MSDSLLMSLGAIETARLLQNDYVTGMVQQIDLSQQNEDPNHTARQMRLCKLN